MTEFLLDTGPMMAFFNGRRPAVALVDPWLQQSKVATSVLVYGEIIEFLQGKSDFETRRLQLRQLLATVEPLYLSLAVLDLYGTIRRQLRPPVGSGIIGDIDTLIAATALVHDLTIVTTDTDFIRVPGLKVRLLQPRTFEPIRLSRL